jgi:DNA methylase
MPGAVVLDNAMGIGSTGISAANTGRRFIGIEKDPKFFQIAGEVLRSPGRASARRLTRGGKFASAVRSKITPVLGRLNRVAVRELLFSYQSSVSADFNPAFD